MKTYTDPYRLLAPIKLKKTSLAIAIGLSACSSLVSAATFTVSSVNDFGEGSLRAAIDSANAMAGADDIVFDSALDGLPITLLQSVTITEPLSIKGNGRDKTLININTDEGANFNLAAAGEDITISDMTLDTARAGEVSVPSGEMISNGIAVGTGANLTVSNTAFDNSNRIARTSAIRSTGPVNIISSRVSNFNQAMVFSEELTIRDSEFSDNSLADPYGGIIRHSSSSTVTIQSSVFQNNISTPVSGGATALYKFGGITNIESCSFINNMSGANRSVLDVGGVITIRNSIFENNIGSAIASDSSAPGEELSIDSSIFKNNSRSNGGAIYNEFRTLSITNSVFEANNARLDGGAIFTDRFATEGGGVVLRVQQNISIVNSTFSGNIAGNNGGALRINPTLDSADISLNLLNVTMVDNDAKLAGKAINATPKIPQLPTPRGNIERVAETAGAGTKAFAAGRANANIYNSIIASSTGDTGGNDILVGIYNADSSLIGTSANATIIDVNADSTEVNAATKVSAGINLLNINPELDLFKDNGGKRVGPQKDQPLLSYAALDGSPVIDAGNSAAQITITIALGAGIPAEPTDLVIDLPLTDQRGDGFPRITDSSVDMGAIESASIAPVQVTDIPDIPVNVVTMVNEDLSVYFEAREGQTIRFSAEGLPAGIELSPSGLLSGTLLPAAAGTLPLAVALSASADGAITDAVFNLVLDNLPPTINVESLPLAEININEAFEMDLSPFFDDPELLALEFSASGSLPPGFTLSNEGIFAGTLPIAGATALGSTVSFTVSDSANPALTASFKFGNDLIQQRAIPDITVNLRDPVQISLAQYFSSQLPIMFSSENLPAELIVSQDGVLNGTITAETAATLPAAVTLLLLIAESEGTLANLEVEFNILLEDLPPIKTGEVPVNPINFGDEIEFDLTNYFSDPESRPLVFAGDDIPNGFSLSAQGLFKGTLSEVHTDIIGSDVSFTVSDGINPPVRFSFKLGERGANKPPALAAVLPAFWFPAGKPTEYNLAKYICDPEAQPLTFSAANLPSSLSLSADGMLSGTLEEGTTLPESFMLVAVDESELSFEQEITLRSGSDAIATPKQNSGGGPIDFGLFSVFALAVLRLLRSRKIP